eukprot:752038-Hanusia_phi.AAC.1
MRQQIERYVLSCQSCLDVSHTQTSNGILSREVIVPRLINSLQFLSGDVVPGFPATTTGYDSIFVCLDNFSGGIFLSPCKKTPTSQQDMNSLAHPNPSTSPDQAANFPRPPFPSFLCCFDLNLFEPSQRQ